MRPAIWLLMPQKPLHLLIVALLLSIQVFGWTTFARSEPQPSDEEKLARFQADYDKLRQSFTTELELLATKADENQLSDLSEKIREHGRPVERRSLLTTQLPSEVRSPSGKEELWEEFWRLRKSFSKDLYLLSRRVFHAGLVSHAYEMVREVLHHDPDHVPARGLFGFVRQGNAWMTPYAAEMVRKQFQYTDDFGWLPKDHVKHYQNGERYYQGRWISVAQESEIRRDFRQAWEVRTEHFRIRSNHSYEKGIALGKQLESFYKVFDETFAGFLYSPEHLKRLFEGQGTRPIGQTRPYTIVYFRTQDEYLKYLKGKAPAAVSITTGIYLSAEKSAFFFENPDPELAPETTLYHEATHQLFAENRSSNRMIGRYGNFFVVEGIACYLESFSPDDADWPLGNPKYIRFKNAQFRAVRDKYYVPLEDFAAMGADEFQASTEISKYYSQASGVIHFFMHYKEGVYREALITHLSDIYSLNSRVRDTPRTMEELTGVSYNELDRQYLKYIADLPTGLDLGSNNVAPIPPTELENQPDPGDSRER